MKALPFRPSSDALTLRLDRWASILDGYSDDGNGAALTLTGDELADLSTLCTAAANTLAVQGEPQDD